MRRITSVGAIAWLAAAGKEVCRRRCRRVFNPLNGYYRCEV